MTPHMKAITCQRKKEVNKGIFVRYKGFCCIQTFRGLVIVMVSIVVVGAILFASGRCTLVNREFFIIFTELICIWTNTN